MSKRKSICLISFSPVARDARVLRQIEYLSPHFDLTVIGEGEAHPSWPETVIWNPVPVSEVRRLHSKLAGLALLSAGRLYPAAFLQWYWRQPIMKDALAKAVASRGDAFHANDWNALPIAIEASRRLGGARVVFDDHEYAPLDFENRRVWSMVYLPMVRHMLSIYAGCADAIITVAPAIAERYQRDFHLNPMVLLNAPSKAAFRPVKEIDFDNIKLVHHGSAIPDRRLEEMIRTLSFCDKRYSLYLMLMRTSGTYLSQLRRLADDLAPGRVTFLDPVATENVVERISEFDMGFCYIAPTTFSYLVSLPNKFFDFIAAGLPVCIGPSPSMAEIVERYGLGCVASTFEPRDVATALNALTPEQLVVMRDGARRASEELNAEREMGKLVGLYGKLLAEQSVT